MTRLFLTGPGPAFRTRLETVRCLEDAFSLKRRRTQSFPRTRWRPPAPVPAYRYSLFDGRRAKWGEEVGILGDAIVGVVANPLSGRDIRRLVTQASVFPTAAVGNTEACVTRRRMSRPESGFATTPTIASPKMPTSSPHFARLPSKSEYLYAGTGAGGRHRVRGKD